MGEICSYDGVKVRGEKQRRVIHLHDMCLMSMPQFFTGCDVAAVLSKACTVKQFTALCPLCKRGGTTLQCFGKNGKCRHSYHFGCAWKAGCAFSSHLGWVIFCPDCLGRGDAGAELRLAFRARHSICEWSGIWTADVL